MNKEQYRLEIQRTWNQQELKKDILHAILLLGSEYGEYLNALKKNIGYGNPLDIINVEEELGDMMYAIFTLERLFKLDLYELDLEKIPADSLYNDLSNLDNVFIRFTEDTIVNEHKYMQVLVMQLYTKIRRLIAFHNLNLENVFESNINKLKVRFPKKFTSENNDNRLIHLERNAIYPGNTTDSQPEHAS